MLVQVVGGIAIGLGALLILGMIACLVSAYRSTGPNSGLAFFWLLVLSPLAMLPGVGFCVLGTSTLTGAVWGRVGLEILLWVVNAGWLTWIGHRHRSKGYSSRRQHRRYSVQLAAIAISTIVLAILLRVGVVLDAAS